MVVPQLPPTEESDYMVECPTRFGSHPTEDASERGFLATADLAGHVGSSTTTLSNDEGQGVLIVV